MGAILVAGLLALAPQASADPQACVRVEKPLAMGEVPLREELAPVACVGDRADAGFRYDRAAGTVRAIRDLSPGSIVAAVPVSLLATVRPGQRLAVTTSVGAATVTREVVALRAARSGEPVLVRGAQGGVFTVPQAEARR
jgi:flagella basal body P-ring formation protein FlgA